MESFLKRKSDYFIPIRWKLIVYLLIFMVLLVFIGVYINLGSKMTAQVFKGTLDEYQYLEVLGAKIYEVKYFTESYLADDNFANLESSLAAGAELREYLEKITGYVNFGDNQVKYYSYLDLSKCVSNFINLSEKTLNERRNGFLDNAYNYNYRMNLLAELISKYLTVLINRNANWGSDRFNRLTHQTERIEFLAYSLAVVIGLLSIVFCINFSLGITQPLEQMVRNAKKIGKGNFSVQEIAVDSNDEMRIITEVFNKMSRNINSLFNEIQQKAALEDELKEEKMRNLEFQNLLRETEIQNLQSQINPHFLYNTLNAISQVAILEEAQETGELIKVVARLLRYNLRSLDRPVTVMDEINHIKEYIYIMGVRYGEKIRCELNYSGQLNKLLIPCMTLQPILENAYIHGVAGLTDRQGLIQIIIEVKEERLRIEISDNGVGMSQSKLEKLLQAEPVTEASLPKKGKTSGLGLANIRKRLELFYQQQDLLTITSGLQQGTKVSLDLPVIEEGDTGVQFNDCG